jgi:MFS transporter, AAHS family, 4-hydroxybenzoate transporter
LVSNNVEGELNLGVPPEVRPFNNHKTGRRVMALTRTIDVQDFMNSHKLSSYQIRIIALCFLIVAIDGFDTAAIGFIAPALRAEWGVTAAQLAPLFGAGLFGLMVGAFIFGPLADKIGRKYALVLTVLFFGGASLASAWSTSITELTILRFLTGMGLGGAMPNAITLTSDSAPRSAGRS